jgi:cytochrome b6-f complex iron-sulfur subunit
VSAGPPPWSRRALLQGCAACAAWTACGGDPKGDPGTGRGGEAPPAGDSGALPDSGGAEDPPVDSDCVGEDVDTTGWVEIPLADHPALALVGGASVIERPDVLLQAILVHHRPGCYGAVWRVCTHGACILSWVAAVDAAVCPCHGSQFALDGAIRVGPATVPAVSFRVLRRGDLLLLER